MAIPVSKDTVFTRQQISTSVLSMVHETSKRAIITGGNAGLGFQVVRRLVTDGFSLELACRSLERGAAAKKLLLAANPQAKIRVSHLDLSDLNSVKAFVARQSDNSWDLLINNAGAKIERPAKLTAQGFEWHVGVNHLAHFALTRELWPFAAKMARVVTVSSVVARAKKLDLRAGLINLPASMAYANSKLMNFGFAMHLSKLLEHSDKSSIAAHPGFARASAYGNRFIRLSEYIFAQSARSGSLPIYEACSSSNGSYLAPNIFEVWCGPKMIFTKSSIMAKRPVLSEDLMHKLWKNSEELTGGEFNPVTAKI